MSLPEATGSSLSSSASFQFAASQPAGEDAPPIHSTNRTGAQPFVERRRPGNRNMGRHERRQFGSSHANLSQEGRELALAIDRYKVENHRRYLTCDEMITVLAKLGYTKS